MYVFRPDRLYYARVAVACVLLPAVAGTAHALPAYQGPVLLVGFALFFVVMWLLGG